MSFLASESVREWVQPHGGHPELNPRALVASCSDTLYLFSEEGPGSAGPLIAALTRAVLSAAEDMAKHQPSGRLPKPFLAILDEAGNICRIPDLPDKYTTYGSRGIIPVTILQTQEQGEQVWGVTGFGKLWASSTVRVFGGGNGSNTFLRDLSELIGDYEYHHRPPGWSLEKPLTQVGAHHGCRRPRGSLTRPDGCVRVGVPSDAGALDPVVGRQEAGSAQRKRCSCSPHQQEGERRCCLNTYLLPKFLSTFPPS